MLGSLAKPADAYRARLACHAIQVGTVLGQLIVIAPWIEYVLAIAVEREIRLEGVAREAAYEFRNVERFRLGEGLAAPIRLGAGAGRGALAAPLVAKVTVEIDAGTLTSMGAHILAPQTIRGMGVFVAIGIGHRMDVPVNVAHVFGQILPALEQLIRYKADSGWTNPFTCVHAAIDPYARIACIAIGDPTRISITLHAPRLWSGNSLT